MRENTSVALLTKNKFPSSSMWAERILTIFKIKFLSPIFITLIIRNENMVFLFFFFVYLIGFYAAGKIQTDEFSC